MAVEISKAPATTGNSPVTELTVGGMTCGNCARHVTEAVQSVPGVHSAAASLDSHQVSVRWTVGAQPDVNAVIQAVEQAGYSAKVSEASGTTGAAALGGWHSNLWVGVLGTVPLMIGEWVFGLGMTAWFQWLSFAIASVVQIAAGAPFYRGAWKRLKLGGSNMDTLVALGSSTAFGYSAWALLSGHGGHLYFMEAAAIITLISVGHWMESRVSARASSTLQKLLDLAPQTARRLAENKAEEMVPIAALKTGEAVLLRPGDRVPTDGEVMEGDAAVDQSMLTGESAPVDKTAGSKLYAGTTNLNGRLTMRVTQTGDATALAHVIAAVQRAQTSRADIQRLGDRVSSVFVPIVVAIALAAGLWWGLAQESAQSTFVALAPYFWTAHPPAGVAAGFIIAAAVLIVACPCAMGLATPAAIMAASNSAAKRGILIRDGVALEKAGKVSAVVFDKTGTLTVGKPEVAANWQLEIPKPETQNPKLILAAALARHSSHPISQAVALVSAEETDVTEWKEIRGAGVQGIVHFDGGPKLVKLGSLRWLRELDVDLTRAGNFIEEHSAQGATIVGMVVENSLEVVFAVKDTVKSGSAKVVEQLQRQGLKIYLVTGDNLLSASGIAKQAGIRAENIFAEVRPEQKAEFVRKLQQHGERVAFVGDGINDAPALEQADLGIAVTRASDVAREAADMVLLNSEIEAVPEALGLSRATLRTIKQNLFWAFFYNAVGVPLAALGFMSPILCAAAMGLSDLIVIGNALRLKRWRAPRIAP